MKKILLVVAIGISSISYAQCYNDLKLTGSYVSFVDSTGKEITSKEESVIVLINKTEIQIIPGDDENEIMKGKITEKTCNWTVPMKEGKIVIKSPLVENSGRTNTATITIEGKDGKLTFLGEAREFPNRKIKFTIDKYEMLN